MNLWNQIGEFMNGSPYGMGVLLAIVIILGLYILFRSKPPNVSVSSEIFQAPNWESPRRRNKNIIGGIGSILIGGYVFVMVYNAEQNPASIVNTLHMSTQLDLLALCMVLGGVVALVLAYLSRGRNRNVDVSKTTDQ